MTQPKPEPKPNSGFNPRQVSGRSPNQKAYIKTILSNDITFCHGPAGSGKTCIAVGMSVRLLKENEVHKIIICRPAVDAGASIGFLPGAMEDKMMPYMVPVFDELAQFAERKSIKAWQEHGLLEIVPLSLMRGRTFNNAFIILDEAQNATRKEIRMTLTRIGRNSKMVIVGDLKQTDLEDGSSGLQGVINDLQGIEGIGTTQLDASDIVRHRLIAQIEERLS